MKTSRVCRLSVVIRQLGEKFNALEEAIVETDSCWYPQPTQQGAAIPNPIYAEVIPRDRMDSVTDFAPGRNWVNVS